VIEASKLFILFFLVTFLKKVLFIYLLWYSNITFYLMEQAVAEEGVPTSPPPPPAEALKAYTTEESVYVKPAVSGKKIIQRIDILSFVVVCVLAVFVLHAVKWYNNRTEGWSTGRGNEILTPYPPDVRVTRTGLKYYNQPYSVDLRNQLNVPILPPIIVNTESIPGVEAVMGPLPLYQPPPPSLAQVVAYPPDSNAMNINTIDDSNVSVKLGSPPMMSNVGLNVDVPALIQPTANGNVVLSSPNSNTIVVPAASPAPDVTDVTTTSADIAATRNNNGLNNRMNGTVDETESYA
jgi:hypothetical protein